MPPIRSRVPRFFVGRRPFSYRRMACPLNGNSRSGTTLAVDHDNHAHDLRHAALGKLTLLDQPKRPEIRQPTESRGGPDMLVSTDSGKGDLHFQTQLEAEKFLVERLSASISASQSEVEGAVRSAQIAERVPVMPAPPPGGSPGLLPRFRWVIRKDDLDVLDAMLSGAQSVVSVGFFVAAGVSAPACWAVVVGILASAWKLVRSASRKGRVLDAVLWKVLLGVRLREPISMADLSMALQQSDANWTDAKTEEALQLLSDLPMNDGTTRSLVVCDVDNRWRTVGI